ncbi:hypothetical protein H2201_007932 [Coniosporium apollinis]|uniref:Uncharacterized protein n=1 Tax=Coniosporium apollinis TaxID=61459 RepID=A0ABQ9NK28_9PEZI|nr:hypothetical protein H2201_007932 [Coniosporium apollinis]
MQTTMTFGMFPSPPSPALTIPSFAAHTAHIWLRLAWESYQSQLGASAMPAGWRDPLITSTQSFLLRHAEPEPGAPTTTTPPQRTLAGAEALCTALLAKMVAAVRGVVVRVDLRWHPWRGLEGFVRFVLSSLADLVAGGPGVLDGALKQLWWERGVYVTSEGGVLGLKG